MLLAAQVLVPMLDAPCAMRWWNAYWAAVVSAPVVVRWRWLETKRDWALVEIRLALYTAGADISTSAPASKRAGDAGETEPTYLPGLGEQWLEAEASTLHR